MIGWQSSLYNLLKLGHIGQAAPESKVVSPKKFFLYWQIGCPNDFRFTWIYCKWEGKRPTPASLSPIRLWIWIWA